MTDEEKSKELTQSSFAAQMAMLGYEPNGNPKDMVEVVRCKDCKFSRICLDVYKLKHVYKCMCHIAEECHDADWFCADGERQ